MSAQVHQLKQDLPLLQIMGRLYMCGIRVCVSFHLCDQNTWQEQLIGRKALFWLINLQVWSMGRLQGRNMMAEGVESCQAYKELGKREKLGDWEWRGRGQGQIVQGHISEDLFPPMHMPHPPIIATQQQTVNLSNGLSH